MTQIQVSLGAVLGDKNFTVLKRTHGARIHIDIGVELEQGDLDTPGLQDRCQGSRGNTLTKRRNHTTCDEDVMRHISLLLRCIARQKNTHTAPGGSDFDGCESCEKMGSQATRKPQPAQSKAMLMLRSQWGRKRVSPGLAAAAQRLESHSQRSPTASNSPAR